MDRNPIALSAYGLNLRRVVFHGACCMVFLLLAGCASNAPASTAGSGASTPRPTATATMAPTATPTPNFPTLSKALLTYNGHGKAVVGIAWSPDGKEMVSGSDDYTVQAWSTQTGKQVWSYNTGSYVFAVAWSPDGKEIAAGGGDGSVTLLNAATGKLIANYTGQTGFIQGLAWSPDSKRIASGSEDGTVLVRDAASGRVMVNYTGHSSAVQRIAWSPNGTDIASASYDGTVQIWNASNGQHVLTYKGNGAPVWMVAWSPDGKKIVSSTGSAGTNGPVSSGNTVKVWDATTGQTLLTYTGYGDANNIYALAWSRDSKLIASGGDDNMVRIWNATTGQTIMAYKGHTYRLERCVVARWQADCFVQPGCHRSDLAAAAIRSFLRFPGSDWRRTGSPPRFYPGTAAVFSAVRRVERRLRPQ